MSDGDAAAQLAAALRDLKSRKGRSFEALAKRLGVSKSALHRYTSGDALPPQFSLIEALARECDATVHELAQLRRWWQAATSSTEQRSLADGGATGAEPAGSTKDVPAPDGALVEPAAVVAPPAVVAPHRRAAWRRMTWSVAAAAAVLGAVLAGVVAVTVRGSGDVTGVYICDPTSAQHVDARQSGYVWVAGEVCPNRSGAAVYAEPTGGVRVAVLDGIVSWFACWTAGPPRPDGPPSIWYYTRGDFIEPGAEKWFGWGFVAAEDLPLAVHPAPALPRCSFPAVDEPSVRFADLDGDGRDEAIDITPAGNVTTGTSGAEVVVARGFTNPARVRLADLDGDHRAELIDLNPDGRVIAYRNQGRDAAKMYDGGNYEVVAVGFSDASRVRFADVDGDRRAELIDLNPDGRVIAYRNQGWDAVKVYDGDKYVVAAVGFTDPSRVRFADIDGDRRAELVSLDSDGTVVAYHNQGWDAAMVYTDADRRTVATGADSRSITFADLDGDGRAEVTEGQS